MIMKWLILALVIGLAPITIAQSSARFAITRNVIAGGGTTASTSSRFRLDSTIAQPLAAVPSSARFSIQGGFWIVPAPIFYGPSVAGTNLLVSIQSEAGKTYTVQYMDGLGSGWQSLPAVAGTGGILTLTNSSAGVSRRFYRLMEH